MEEIDTDPNQAIKPKLIKTVVELYQNLKIKISTNRLNKKTVFGVLCKHKFKQISYDQLDYINKNLPKDKDYDTFCAQILKDCEQEEEKSGVKEKAKFKVGSYLNFNFSNDMLERKIKVLGNFRMPNHEEYQFCNLPVNNEVLNTFLLCSIAPNQKKLVFNNTSSVLINCSSYFYYLRDAVSNFAKIVKINTMSMSLNEFCSIIIAAKKTRIIEFADCKICIDYECDFKNMTGCLIKSLSFIKCFSDGENEWNQSLMNILAGVDSSNNMKNSILKINLANRNKESHETIISEIRDKFKELNHIEICIQNKL